MQMKLRLMVTGLILSAGMAMAAVDTETVISDLQAQGYTWIEVKRGPTQIKIEAVKGSEKVETVLDIETGAVLKQEVETASARDQGRTGVQVRDRDRDFVGGSRSDDDDDGDDSDDDDDGKGRGRGGDDDDGEDDNRGHGNDDDHDDDDNPGRGGDDSDDDDRGRGNDDDGDDD